MLGHISNNIVYTYVSVLCTSVLIQNLFEAIEMNMVFAERMTEGTSQIVHIC